MPVAKRLSDEARRYWCELTPAGMGRPALVLAAAAAAAAIVSATGGSHSDYGPVLLLPIALAILVGGPELILTVGLVLTVVSYGVMHPHGMPAAFARTEAVQAGSIAIVALAGALLVSKRSRQVQEARRTAEEKEILLNASQAVDAADRLDHAVNSALLLLPALVPHFRSAALFLADPSHGHLELCGVIGIDRSELRLERIAMNALWPGWHPGDPHPLYLPHAGVPRDGEAAVLDPGARSCVCAGLRSSSSDQPAVGTLYLGSERPAAFSRAQIDLLQAFADRICFPLQKIRMQEGLAGMAFTDALTGLYNYRYLQTHLADEVARSNRYGRPLSLILLDIDDFKQANDRFGHPGGDRVLVHLADVIRSTVRETDVAARYGGEEFAVISPETFESGAIALAERIRAAVEASRVTLDTGQTVSVTVSVGVATFPEDAGNQQGLVQAADKAMYGAKRAGKNQIVAAGTIAGMPALSAPGSP